MGTLYKSWHRFCRRGPNIAPIQNDRMYMPDSEQGIVIGEGYGVEASKLSWKGTSSRKFKFAPVQGPFGVQL